ncbi:cellulose binding domain-containing protein [Actinoplanes couchii]|uniref:CBM2 domain-containing protein n=1 Tax=Actinoplanes couchii TaxID=403638 RepID=A0ABQ3X4I3_9ACTN|nr:cellulose binding domain-containing protein [Actinoplanes couchii]MDR6326232.1 hypothetical protein [Actinoplanes couchii]GID53416.1 hypothetical protein Aco03nite_018200 [Actinoplanes couchii]
MTEPPRGVRPDAAEQHQKGEPYQPGADAGWGRTSDEPGHPEYGPGPLPARQPGEHTHGNEPDLMDRRYDALAAWNESAQTMTMAAVGNEPRPAYRQSVDPGSSAFDPESFRDAVPRHSVPPARTVRRALRTRRERLAAGIMGIVVLGGGAAVAWGSTGEPDRPAVAGVTVAAPATSVVVEPTSTEDAAPSPTPSVSVSPSTSRSTSPSASASPSGSPFVSSTPSRGVTLPAGRQSRGPVRTPTSGPVTTGKPVLSASFGYEDGAGAIQVINTGDADATDWTVGLTVPGGETVTVTSGDVTVVQSGTSVTFRPSGTRVPAAGLVAFSFAVDPVPSETPGGCTIDGRSCG